MVPAYTLTAVCLSLSLLNLWRGNSRMAITPAPRNSGATRKVGAILGFSCLTIAVALPVLLPVPVLPSPTGPYAVGITRYEWLDSSREERFTPHPGDKRDLLVKVWYPAEKSEGARPAAALEDSALIGSALARTLGLPEFVFDYLALSKGHGYPTLPLWTAGGAFPVLIYSHGLGGVYDQNLVQMEELASQGYIVFSIAHPYESAAVRYADGRVALMSDRYLHPEEPDETEKRRIVAANDLVSRFQNADSDATLRQLVKQYFEVVPHLEESLSVWAEDIHFVLSRIELLNTDAASSFRGRLDLDKVGVFGHSLGGAAAGEACLTDGRFKAGLNMDGTQFGGVIDGSISKPFMLLSSENSGSQKVNMAIYGGNDRPFYNVHILGSKHLNFSILPSVSPVFRLIGFLGRIDGGRMDRIVNELILEFFNESLLGLDSPLLKNHSVHFPEVIFSGH